MCSCTAGTPRDSHSRQYISHRHAPMMELARRRRSTPKVSAHLGEAAVRVPPTGLVTMVVVFLGHGPPPSPSLGPSHWRLTAPNCLCGPSVRVPARIGSLESPVLSTTAFQQSGSHGASTRRRRGCATAGPSSKRWQAAETLLPCNLIHRLRSTATPHMRRRTLHVHKIDPHPRLLSRTSPLAAAPVDGSHFCAATIGGGGPSLWGAAATVTIGRVVAEIRLGRDCNAIRLVTADDHTGPVMYGYGPRAVPCSFVAPPSGQITCNTPTKHAACPNWLRITRRRLSSDESAAQAPRPP